MDETKCRDCGETDEEQLNHGAVYGDPYSDTPDIADLCYCHNCADNNNSPQTFISNCCSCEREFHEYDERYILEADDQRNPCVDKACLRCVRNKHIQLQTPCKMCGHTADGYYCSGLCLACEMGLIENYKDKTRAAKAKEMYFAALEVLDNLADAEQDVNDEGEPLEDVKRLRDAVAAMKQYML